MFLTYEQIKTVATGWVEAEESPEGLTFYRLAKEQRDYYRSISDHLGARSLCSASVTLDFWTDSDSVTLTVDGWLLDCQETWLGVDLYENGKMRARMELDGKPTILWPQKTPVSECSVTVPLEKGETHVTVYLPWNLLTRIRSVELADGANFRPYTPKRRWIAFGDSITQGVHAEHTSMTYVNRLARMLDAVVLNQSIAGDVMRDAGVLPHAYPDCDFVTTAMGTNDYRHRTVEDFTHHMPAFLRHLAEEFSTVPIFVLLPLWRGLEDEAPEKPLGTLQSVRDLIAAEASQYPNMTVIDCQHFLPHDRDCYGDDARLHPNNKGFGYYADALYNILKDKL